MGGSPQGKGYRLGCPLFRWSITQSKRNVRTQTNQRSGEQMSNPTAMIIQYSRLNIIDPQEEEPSKARREADHANDSREASLTLVKRVRYCTTPAIESALTLWNNWQSSILLLLDNTYFAYIYFARRKFYISFCKQHNLISFTAPQPCSSCDYTWLYALTSVLQR